MKRLLIIAPLALVAIVAARAFLAVAVEYLAQIGEDPTIDEEEDDPRRVCGRCGCFTTCLPDNLHGWLCADLEECNECVDIENERDQDWEFWHDEEEV